MSGKIIIRTCARALLLASLLFIVPAFVCLIYKEYFECIIFLCIGAAEAVAAFPFSKIKTKRTGLYTREGMAVAALIWIVLSAFGALPFVITGYIPNYINAFFETVSGFTTTGASILPEVEKLSKGMIFWRSFTHWVGGMGIVVLAIAIMPSSNSSLVLIQAESPGPEAGKITPKGKTSSLMLYLIYTALTLLTVLLLWAGHMPLFDAVCHAFGIAGTGGFGIKNTGISYYHSPYIEWVTTIMMAVFGVNFSLYYLILIKRFKEVKKNSEVKVYIIIMLVATALVMINIFPIYGSFSTALRNSAFQVSSIMTSTGYATVDFAKWPMFSRNILILLMFIGACAGSTGGGFKVQRVVILVKSAYRAIKQVLHPNGVTIVKSDGRTISSAVVHATCQYFVIYILILVASIIFISFDNFDFETTFTSVVTCLNNIGPGMALAGPMENFDKFSDFSKIILSFDMLFGRLECLPLIVLFSPTAWKSNF